MTPTELKKEANEPVIYDEESNTILVREDLPEHLKTFINQILYL